jgi:signal transduction histidine kinase
VIVTVGEPESFDRMAVMTDHATHLAHDFGNWKTVVDGYCELIKRISVPGSRTAAYANSIVAATASFEQTIRESLSFSSTSYSPLKLRFQINAVLADHEARFRARLPKAIDFELRLGPNIPDLEGDPALLAKLFWNLVQNASHALREAPLRELCIETAFRDGAVVACVSDSGSGMDPETRSKILAGESVSTKREGTGLGMISVHKIVTQFDGRMEINSAPDKGTTFTFYFPAAA